MEIQEAQFSVSNLEHYAGDNYNTGGDTNGHIIIPPEESLRNQLSEPLLGPHSYPNTDNEETEDDNGDLSEVPPDCKGLLFYRTVYFLNGLSSSTWGRFGIIYYNRVKHLNPGHIGILQGITPVLGFLCQPLWGWASDVIQSRKTIYVFCKVCSAALLLSLAFPAVNSFVRIFLVVSGMACFSSRGVLDAHTLDFLGEKHRGMYGTIRLWTAVSWGLGAVIMGWITDRLGFEWNFGLYGIMMFMTLALVIFGFPARSKSEQECYERLNGSGDGSYNSSSGPRVEVLKRALLRLPVILWLVEVSIIGAGMGIVESFLFVYLQNDLKTSTELCGYTVGVTVLLELPIFHFSDFLLSKLGHDILFVLSMMAYSSRVFGYTYLTPSSANWILLLEFSHGITFACMWIASIDYAAAIAPKEWSTTVQSTLATALTLGGAYGPIVGGFVMDKFGAVFLFRSVAVLVTVLLFVHLVVWLALKQGHDKFLEQVRAEQQTRRIEESHIGLSTDEEENGESDDIVIDENENHT